ncbi:MAG: dockerin type I domain-containing protein [Planctomycetota bacterium]
MALLSPARLACLPLLTTAGGAHAQAIVSTFDNFTPSGLVAVWAEDATNTGSVVTSGPTSWTIDTTGHAIILPSGTQIPSPGGFGFAFADVADTDASGETTFQVDLSLTDDGGTPGLGFAAIFVIQDNDGDQAVYNFSEAQGDDLFGLGNFVLTRDINDFTLAVTNPGTTNNQVDFDDLFAFQYQIATGAGFGYAVEFHDARFLTPVAGLAGDANGDGVVDLLDFDVLAQNFGSSTGNGAADGDFNADGVVDLLDFDVLAQNFGSSSPSAVPEPASLGLIGPGAAALVTGRRRRA